MMEEKEPSYLASALCFVVVSGRRSPYARPSHHRRLTIPPIHPFHVSPLISYDARRRCRRRGNPRQAQEKRQDAEGHGADT